MIDVPCALCGSDERRALHDVDRFREPVRIVRCAACGHVYRSPRPAGDDADGYYDEDYYRGPGDEGAFRYVDEREHEPAVRLKARSRLARMKRVLGSPGRLLEIGCSFGVFLDEARDRGWTPRGVDVSAYASRYARESLGLEVHHGHVEDMEEPSGSFDAAYLSETVEHLADPLGTLRRAAELLREGGLVVVGTGNVGSLAARLRGGRWGYYMPGHLQYFSIRSLTRALTASGFMDVSVLVPDDRGMRAAAEFAALQGRSRLRASLAWLLRAPRLGPLAVGAGMVAYARRAGT
jgi:SAM-dependent methyltransferase